MPAKKKAAGTVSPTSRSRVTSALRKASGAVAKATGRKQTASTSAKKAVPPVTRTAAKKSAAAKTAAKRGAAKKAAAPAAKNAAAKKATPSRKATTGTTVAKKVPAQKAAAKKATGKAAATKTTSKTPAKKTATKVATKRAAKKAAVKKTAARKSAPPSRKSAAATAAPTRKAAQVKQDTAAQQPATRRKTRQLRVRDDESPWTAEELAAVRAELEGDVARLSAELSGFEDDIAGLIKDSGDGAGDDQADAGAKTFEREHEYSLAQNSRDLLEQSVHALERIDDGTYGVCENCGNAIGKLRLQAFPRATLCLTCKAQQERR